MSEKSGPRTPFTALGKVAHEHPLTAEEKEQKRGLNSRKGDPGSPKVVAQQHLEPLSILLARIAQMTS